jgi:hypothetical protein
MLLPAEVVPFLLHEDPDVRAHAVEYLARGHDPAPATADDVWTAMDRHGDQPRPYGGNERAWLAVHLKRFPPTPRATGRLFEAIRADPASELGERLVRAALELPPATYRELFTDEAVRTRLPAGTVAAIDDELTLAEAGFDALWTELDGVAVELGETWTVDAPGHRRARRIERALARFDADAGARGAAILDRPPAREPAAANMESFVVELFGRVPFPGPLGSLLCLFSEEGDYTNERVVDALVRVGTPEVVAAVEARHHGGGPVVEYAPGLLGRIRRPESEAALFRLLEFEDDPYRATDLAMNLLDLCTTSPDALGFIEQMIEDGAYDPMLVDLDELLVMEGKMVGWSSRNPAAWSAKPKLLRPAAAIQGAMERLEERLAPRAPERPTGRGFVPFGKKARQKKAKQKR